MLEDLIATLDVLPDPERCSAATLVDTAAVLHKCESVVCAFKLGFASELLVRFKAEPLFTVAGVSLDYWDSAEAELGPALAMTPSGASSMLQLGHQLATRLPNVWDAFRRGDLDLHRVRIIVTATQNVTDEHIKRVEYLALDRILKANKKCPLSGARLRAVVDAAIVEVDADGLRQRREAAHKDRHVKVFTAPDGMTDLEGKLSAGDGMFLTNRLAEMAKRVCSDDPRSFQARRADALVALANGQSELSCQCGLSECPYRSKKLGEPNRFLVHVFAREDTLDGTSEKPGWIDGHGVIDAAYTRDLAATAKLRLMAEPFAALSTVTGLPISTAATVAELAAELRYRPTQSKSDRVRALHGSCQFPGCNRASWESDLDHKQEFNHRDPKSGGRTRDDNLGPFCRKHHLERTFGGWKFETDPDGNQMLISRLGKRYDCTPFGPIAVLGGRLRCRTGDPEPPTPKRRTRAQQLSDRIRAERRQLRCHREIEREYKAQAAHAARLIDPDDPPPF